MAENSVKELKDFFGTASEMMVFWKSLSYEEKNYYQNADLD